jgi:hypothetical protein
MSTTLLSAISNRFSVLPMSQNALVIGKGKYGQKREVGIT